jgi:L-ascorbate metabolism protein UlaG (beta-lactamase superfamily)
MIITKFGHSCFIAEFDAKDEAEEKTGEKMRALFDPGSFSKGQNEAKNVDVLLITHVHGDHFDLGSVKQVLANNPNIPIYTTHEVKEVLQRENIAAAVITNGESVEVKGVKIEAVGELHAVLVTQMPPSQNIGYMINNELFFPGDALIVPPMHVRVLALPISAPWARMSEIIDYAISVKPDVAFPVHEAILADPNMFMGMMQKLFEQHDIDLRSIELNKPTEY